MTPNWFFILRRAPPASPLFPYTTLFRSALPVENVDETASWLMFVDDSELGQKLAQGIASRAPGLVKVEAGPEFARFDVQHYCIRAQARGSQCLAPEIGRAHV